MSVLGAGKVTAVENLRSNCVILRGFRAAARSAPSEMTASIDGLNGLEGRPGYIYESFAGRYFTEENCARMDAVREEIAARASRGETPADVLDYLLASFLLAADRVANTLGQYDAFLKNIGASPRGCGRRHLVDERVKTPFRMRPLAVLPIGGMEVMPADIMEVIDTIEVDVAYFDPPYNGRQYCDNYHVLENLARWEKPPLYGKTRKFDRTGMRSPFSTRAGAKPSLRALLERTRAPHIFLSYNSEGILARKEIEEMLFPLGKLETLEMHYPVFGNGAGVSRKRSIKEYLFHLRKAG
jgi:adenine-specific DNA-methyltransferase